MHQDMEHFIHGVVTNLPVSDVKLIELENLVAMILLCKCYTDLPWRVGLNINVMYLLVLNHHSGMCRMTFMLQMEFYLAITG